MIGSSWPCREAAWFGSAAASTRDLGTAARRRREAVGLPDGIRVYLAAGRTDLRRGIDGLAAQIQTVLREDPFSGHLFIFGARGSYDQGSDV